MTHIKTLDAHWNSFWMQSKQRLSIIQKSCFTTNFIFVTQKLNEPYSFFFIFFFRKSNMHIVFYYTSIAQKKKKTKQKQEVNTSISFQAKPIQQNVPRSVKVKSLPPLSSFKCTNWYTNRERDAQTYMNLYHLIASLSKSLLEEKIDDQHKRFYNTIAINPIVFNNLNSRIDGIRRYK